MPRCRDCDSIVVFLRKPGGWLPPVEPVLDFADGEYVVMGPAGEAIPLPQIFRRHRCPEELNADPADLADRRARREIDKLDREAERNRMLEEAAFRRDQLAREQERRFKIERENQDAIDEAQERRYDEERRSTQLFEATRNLDSRIGSVKCPQCDSEPGEPCKSSRPNEFYIITPHQARRKVAPPAPLRPQRRRWGDDYEGPWPPEQYDDPSGWRIMRRWLMNNHQLFGQIPIPVQKEMKDDRTTAEPGGSDPTQEEVEARRPATPDFIQPQL